MSQNDIQIREYLPSDSVSEITKLLHKSYAKLAAMGLIYLAAHQDDETTARRLAKGKTFIAIINNQIIGTISIYGPNKASSVPIYRQDGVFHFGQFAVDPAYQGNGLGRRLYQAIENYCLSQNGTIMALDTSEKAHNLISIYEKWGFKTVAKTKWKTTNFTSVIMTKPVLANQKQR